MKLFSVAQETVYNWPRKNFYQVAGRIHVAVTYPHAAASVLSSDVTRVLGAQQQKQLSEPPLDFFFLGGSGDARGPKLKCYAVD